MARIIEYRRYAIDVTELDPLSLGELGGLQCFSKFGASGCAMMLKIGRRVRDQHKVT